LTSNVAFSGWGVRSDWYRNVRAHPEVFITVGRRRIRAMARVVDDPERRRQLMQQMQARSPRCGPPQPVRPLLKRTGLFDYDAEIKMAVAAGETLPVVERPLVVKVVYERPNPKEYSGLYPEPQPKLVPFSWSKNFGWSPGSDAPVPLKPELSCVASDGQVIGSLPLGFTEPKRTSATAEPPLVPGR